MTGMSDEELGRVLAAAVPPTPAPPDRLDRVAARVGRRRALRTTGAAVSLAAVVLAAAAVPRMWVAPSPDARAGGSPSAFGDPSGYGDPSGSGDPSGYGDPSGRGDEDPICVPTPHVTPAPSPFGGQWPPRLAGAVRVTLCEWTLAGPRYVLARRLIVTAGVGDVVSTVLAAPDTEVPAYSPGSYRCTDADRDLKRGLAFDFDDAPRQWVAVTCDVLWQSSWLRFGGRDAVDTVVRLAASQPPPASPTGGRR